MAAMATFGQEAAKPKTDADVPRITVADAKQAFDKKSAIFIDARSTEAYNLEHIKGAVSAQVVDYNTIAKDKTLIIYCS